MSAVEGLSPDEKRAYDLITSEGGVLQSELWKELDASSRKGSRLAKSLAEKELIKREETVGNGRTTYLLTPTNGERSSVEGSEDEPKADETEEPSTRKQRALSLIQDTGGIYQSEFWKKLDVSSRTGSRIATSLEEKGLIRRDEAAYNGQRTYFLQPAKQDLDFSLLMAGDEISPIVAADGEIDPIQSNELTQWILRLAQERR